MVYQGLWWCSRVSVAAHYGAGSWKLTLHDLGQPAMARIIALQMTPSALRPYLCDKLGITCAHCRGTNAHWIMYDVLVSLLSLLETIICYTKICNLLKLCY
jgi:hypothetical protein